MTDADLEVFSKSIVAMSVAYGQQLEEARLFAYWEALQDVPIELVTGAMAEAMRHAEFFPTIAVLRKLADAVAMRAREPVHVLDDSRLLAGETPAEAYDKGPRELHVCRDCMDTGFMYHECSPDLPVEDRCGNPMCRQGAYIPHRYVTLCLCRPTNPNFQRKLVKKFKHEV